MKHVSKWVVISEQTHYHSPPSLQPDPDHIRQQGPGVVFASHHTKVIKHMDKGNMFKERKGRSQRLSLLSTHVNKGWKRSCHSTEKCRWEDAHTSTCVPRQLGQKLWSRPSFTCLPHPSITSRYSHDQDRQQHSPMVQTQPVTSKQTFHK